MISIENHACGQLCTEIRAYTANLPRYQGGPGADYTNTDRAYAASIILLYDPTQTGGTFVPRAQTEILLVQRGTGHGTRGEYSGAGGYLDTAHDPNNKIAPQDFCALAHTIAEELAEECGLSAGHINHVRFVAGTRFTQTKWGGGELHVVPVVGIWNTPQKPAITIDNDEIIGYQWLPLNKVASEPKIAPSFVEFTIVHAMHSFTQAAQLRQILAANHK